MSEELIPGLVRVIEERLGFLGRPFTTLMVLTAGLGVIAWGFSQIYKTFVAPLLDMMGIEPGGSDLAQALTLLGMAVALSLGAWIGFYAIERIQRQRVSVQLIERDEQIRELKKRLDSQQGNEDVQP